MPADQRAGVSETLISSLWRRLLSGSVWAFGSKVVAMVAGVATSAIVTRLLSPEDVGAYFLSLSVATFAAMVGRIGLDKTVLQLVARSIGQDPARAKEIVKRVLQVGATGVAAVAGVLWLGAARWIALHIFSSPAIAAVRSLLAAWVVILGLEILLAETFRAFDDIPKASVLGGPLTRVLTVVALGSVLVYAGRTDLHTVLLVTILAGAVTLLGSGSLLTRKVRALKAGPTKPVPTGWVLQNTWPLLVSNLTLLVVGQADIWIMGAFRPQDEVAIYGVAVRLVLLVSLSLTVVNAVLPPLIGKLYFEGDMRRLEHVLRVSASFAAVPPVVALGSFIVLGGPILVMIFGSFYRDGAAVLALLSLGQLANAWVGSCGYTLVMTGHQRELMWSAILSGCISVVGGLATVKSLGSIGVASAVTTGVIIQQTAMLFLARRQCGVWTHASVPLLLRVSKRLLHAMR